MKRFSKHGLFLVSLLALLFLAGCVTDTTTTTTTTSGTTTTTTTTTTSSETTTSTTTLGSFTVSFETNGGTAVTAQTITDGGLVSAVTSTQEDYALLGWYLDEALTTAWNFETDQVTENITLYAAWEFTYELLGSGTELDPYQITSNKDLDVVRDGQFATTETTHFVLTTDLTVETAFETIDGAFFYGILDGQNHVITLTGDSGLFFRNEGTIQQLSLVGDIETDQVNSLGMLAHYNNGTIQNITVSGVGVRSLVGTVGTLEEGIGGAGAIVGTNEELGVIRNCESDTNVQARVGGGGIVGNNQGTVEGCSSWGTVGESEVVYISEAEASVGKFSYAGGIAGINSGLVIQSQNRGRVFAQRAGNSIDSVSNGNKVFGGIVGYNFATGTVTECYNAYGTAGATVHADRIVGGIVGQNFGTVTYSYSPANIGARANLGGIVGLNDESESSVAYIAFNWSNSNFRSDGNEVDEIGAYLAADVTNWYSVAKNCEYCVYFDDAGTRGMAPTGEGNVSGASVKVDMSATLNHGLAVGEEKWIITSGTSSGNCTTKLSWQRYTMTYVVEGVETDVTVPMGNTPVFEGALEKAGYTFMEWRTDLADSGSAWAVGGITANGKVYAYYEPTVYTITYILDGGENDTLNPVSYTIETPTFALLDPSRIGCTFDGWFNDSDVQVTSVELGSTGDLVLTAKYTISVAYLTIHYVDETLSDVTLIDYAGVTLTLPEMTKEGFEFLGWSLDGTTIAYAGGQEFAYADLSSVAVEGVVTLTPLFQQIFNYNIAFDGNGATGTMDSIVAISGHDYTIPKNGFTAEGYTFMGWLLNGSLVQPGETLVDLAPAGETATLLAMWISQNNIVVGGDFPNNGDLVSADTKTFTLDNWNVYRNGTTNVPSLVPLISDNQLVVNATIATGATKLNFYVVTQVTLPNIENGKFYYVSFNGMIDQAGYPDISVILRSKAEGSTTYKDVVDRVVFTSVPTSMTEFSTILYAYQNIASTSTYYLIISLGTMDGGVAGSYIFTLDDICLYELGPVA